MILGAMNHRIVVFAAVLSFGLGLGVGWFAFSNRDIAEGQGRGGDARTGEGSRKRHLSAIGGEANIKGGSERPGGGIQNSTVSASEFRGIVDRIGKMPVGNDGEVVRALEPIVAGLDGAGYAGLMKELEGKFTGRRRQRVLWAIAEKFAETYPREAILFAGEPENYMNRGSTILYAAVSRLGEEAPEDALDLINGLKPGSGRSTAANKLIDIVALSHPDLFIRWSGDEALRQELFGTQQSNRVATAAEFVAGEDPQRALALLDALDLGDDRNSVIDSIAGSWSVLDPVAAFEWVSALPEGERVSATKQFFESASRADPEAVLSMLEGFEGKQRTKLVGEIASGWAESNNRAAMIWAGSLEDEVEKTEAISAIFDQVEMVDPSSVADLYEIIREIPEDSVGEFRTAVSRWAYTDSDAALEWAQHLGGDQQEGALGAVMNSLVQVDPGRVAEFLTEGPDSRRAIGIVKNLMESWTASDAEAASEWARSLEGDARVFATEEFIEGMGARDPERASVEFMALLEAQEVEEDRLKDMGREIAEHLGQVDPHGTAEMLLLLPEGDARRASVDELAAGWARRDPVEVSQWASQLSAGSERDAVANRISYAIASSDAQGALAWAASIGDDNQRIQSLQSVIRRGRGEDPQELRSVIETTELDEAERSVLLRLLDSD